MDLQLRGRTPEDWARQVDITVTGTLHVTRAVARLMVERPAGAIVNLMGDSGRVGESGLLVTATARASTMGLTKSLAQGTGAPRRPRELGVDRARPDGQLRRPRRRHGCRADEANAVADALGPLGVEMNELPLTPGRVWAACQARGRDCRSREAMP